MDADARLVAAHEFFRRGEASAERWSMLIAKDRRWESAYRDRWRHDEVVRSTHGVNCTGSCSWNVYVKDGLISWESQAVDYPRTDPDRPDHEPRGCPQGASFSWHTYSPARLGAAGGLGGFFPPLVMGIVKSATGGYAVSFILMSLVAVACLIVLSALRASQPAAPSRPAAPTGVQAPQ